MKKKVAIYGAGIAGLSAAHELSKDGNYDIVVYEGSDSVGGMAKSYRYINNNNSNTTNINGDVNIEGLPTEYSWRGYGQFYKNVYEVMKEIPSPIYKDINVYDIINVDSVYDTELSKPIQFLFVKDDTTNINEAYNWQNNISTLEYLCLYLFFYKIICSDDRTNEYAKINAKDYLSTFIKPRNLSFITSLFGPWLGIDPQRTSMFHLFNFFRMILYPDLNVPYKHINCNGNTNITNVNSGNSMTKCLSWFQGSGDDWLVLKRPTSESWFDPWVSLLTLRGVTIKYNTSVHKINVDKNNNIESVIVCDTLLPVKGKDKYENIYADYHIIATNPFAVVKVLKMSDKVLQNDPELSKFKGLTQDGPHIQVSFRIGFDTKIHLPPGDLNYKINSKTNTNVAFILPDSEFNITMYFQDQVWYDNVYLGSNIKSLISGTACVSYMPGKLYNKTLIELTEKQFKNEIIYQLSKCKNFNAIIRQYNRTDFNEFLKRNLIVFEAWKGWTFKSENLDNVFKKDENDGNSDLKHLEFDPNEIKWVNSTTTNDYMPNIKTSYKNLMLVGGYVKTSVDLYSMESACATGREAAFDIINSNVINQRDGGNGNVSRVQKQYLKVEKPLLLKSLSLIDNKLYLLRLPNVVDTLLIILTLIFIKYVINRSR